MKHPQVDGALVWDQLARLYHNTNMCKNDLKTTKRLQMCVLIAARSGWEELTCLPVGT